MKTPEEIKKSLEMDVLEYIRQLEANQPKWIGVNDRLPEPDVNVLIVTQSKNGSRNVDKGYYFERDYEDGWVRRGTAKVTHWMPLPGLPEEETE